MSTAESANAAIYYEAEGYGTTGPKLMGRHAAGEGFLRAYVREAKAERFYCYARNRQNLKSFERFCAQNGGAGKPIEWIPFGQPERLRPAGSLFVPGPGLQGFAWRRRRVGSTAFSICGVTHTIASHGAMDSITGFATAPVEPWDALICTSQAVVDAVRKLQDSQAAFLSERLGARPPFAPMLALIPLGVDCAELAPDPARRATWRTHLGVADGEVVFFFMGRLSFHAKANPAPMYLALEEAARLSGKRLHLVQAGWFGNAQIEAEFKNGAKQLCPSVRTSFLDGRDSAVRREAWQAADVFTSLADNIQETFGLTPIEAMAAGLPSVVSDWNGYRDTVRDGIDGFRIPTFALGAPLGARLAARHEDMIDSYDLYIGQASQFISVDVQACAQAYARLAGDADLRLRMGAAARARAQSEFDWRVVLARYRALWAELDERRRAAPPVPPAPAGLANPARLDPYWLFSGYPTTVLEGHHRLALRPGASSARVAEMQKRGMFAYSHAVLPQKATYEFVLDLLSRGEMNLSALLAAAPAAERNDLRRAALWLHKIGVLTLSA